jgi:NADP-dependent 3-hydroxy acid dehydrogenase YdfG
MIKGRYIMQNIQGKVFVVTGAGSGIGRALSLALIQEGAKVAGVDLNEDSLKETKKLAKPASQSFAMFVANVADLEAVAALPKAIEHVFGPVDAIINNAGIIQPFVKVDDLDLEKIRKVMDVNFYGTLYMVKTFLPLLKKRPEAHIINISSMGGFVPVPGQTIYGASKAAVKLLTEGLYSELKGTSVRVTVIFPGAVGTNITKNSGVDMKMTDAEMKEASKKQRSLTAEQAANLIIQKGIKKNRYRLTIGKDSTMLDRLTRLFPQKAADLIAKAMANLLK